MIDGRNMIGPSQGRSELRKLAMLPLVFAGAMVFWTLAFGLGGLSLMGLGSMGGDRIEFIGPEPQVTEPMPMPATIGPADRITVHIQESAEPEDVNDNAGAVAPGPVGAAE